MAKGQLLQSVRVLVLGAFAAVLIKLISLTIRWERKGFTESGLTSTDSKAMIMAFWHGRMLMAPWAYRALRRGKRHKSYMLISRHGDGRLIATAMRLLGIGSVAGSSSRGGMAAMRELVRRSREGCDLGITPDGPRGPRYVCKDGVVSLARLSGLAIYPFSYSTKDPWRLSSWDGMIIPRPFSRGVAIFGAPLKLDPNEDLEGARNRIQDALHAVTQEADGHWNDA
jgi:lysophospholipid acyltransferase (LPLAT)-like uncharacterized protein